MIRLRSRPLRPSSVQEYQLEDIYRELNGKREKGKSTNHVQRFQVFGCLCLGAAVQFFVSYPETGRKSLEEIEEMFR
jgi:hypothetical protein